MVSLHIQRSYFGDNNQVFLEDENFCAILFRYSSGIPAIRLNNQIGGITVLPYHGQMIWDASFFGRDIKMKTSFSQPLDVQSYMDTYGCYLMYCGALRMGQPGKQDTHSLHGELPYARYQKAYITRGQDERGDYLGVGGEFEYNRAFGDHYVAHPLCKLYSNSGVLDISMKIYNQARVPMELMFLFHINNELADGGRFVQPCNWNNQSMSLTNPPSDEGLTPVQQKLRTLLMHSPEKTRIIKPGFFYEPEFTYDLHQLQGDDQGIAHFMQIHPDGSADYTGVELNGLLRNFGRWFSRTPNHSACSLCSPATCGANGYTSQKLQGNVRMIDPGKDVTLKVSTGMLSPSEANRMEDHICKTLGEKA